MTTFFGNYWLNIYLVAATATALLTNGEYMWGLPTRILYFFLALILFLVSIAREREERFKRKIWQIGIDVARNAQDESSCARCTRVIMEHVFGTLHGVREVTVCILINEAREQHSSVLATAALEFALVTRAGLAHFTPDVLPHHLIRKAIFDHRDALMRTYEGRLLWERMVVGLPEQAIAK